MLCNASDRVERQCPRWWTLLVAGGFGLSAILLSGVSLHAQEKKEKVIRVEEKQIDGEAGKPIRLKVEAGGGKEPVILRLEDGKIIQGDRTIRAIVNDEGVIGEAVIVVGDDGDPKTKEVQKKALVELQEALDRATKAAHSDKGLDEARRQLEVAQKRLAEAQKQLEEAKTRVVKPYVNVPTRVKANEALLKLHDGDLADQIRKALEASKKDLESLPAEQRDMVRKRLEEALQHIEENAKKNPKLHKPDGLVPKKTDKELIIHKGEPIKDLLVKPSETGKYILRADGVASGKGRLGIMTDAVPPAVLHHLDLPIGKGLMIVQVLPDTPAAKAGLKEHDIVVQFAGKDVPPDSEAFRKIVVDHKGGPVDVIVLRKGKSTTIKGIGLSEATEGKKLFKEEIEKSLKDKKDFHFKVEPIKKLELEGFKKFDKIDVGDLKKLEWVKAGAGAGGAKSVTTSVIRKDDHLDITHKEDGVTLSINADIEGGKVRINGIGVEEGSSAAKYKSLSEVPEKHRAKVKELLEMGEKGQVRTEIKSKGVR